MPKPVIGISTCFEEHGGLYYYQTAVKYVQAVVSSIDGLPLLIPAIGRNLHQKKLIKTINGLLLTGGYSNIEPHQYNGQTGKKNTKYDPQRDATILSLIPEAIKAKIPILAICRGCQEMNVAFGGSLHQNVHEQPGLMDHREDSTLEIDDQYQFAHSISLVQGGILDQISDDKEPVVNSVHWQGIDQLGEGLEIEATAPDGLIEAFSVIDAKAFTLAVQWHPEWKLMEIPFYKNIFKLFGEACKNHADTKLK